MSAYARQLIPHGYEVRPRKDHRDFDLISDALPFGRLWYERAEDAIGYAKFYSRSHAMVVTQDNGVRLVFVDCQLAQEKGKMKGSTKSQKMDEPFNM